ncbi:MAG: SDR family oxidoreductase [Chloroflexota bacterium]
MDFDLSGRVAIITGASRGIGREIALAYAQAGARVVLASRKQEELEAVAAEIRGLGGAALPVATHVGEPEAVAALVARAVEAYSGVDIAVNNAGTNPQFGSMLETTIGQWDKILDVNLRGAFSLIQQVVPHMRRRGGGKIINMASITGLRPSPAMGIYSISKAGLIMLTQVMAKELGPDSIQVNALAPGVIKTRFSSALWETPEIAGRIVQSTALGRLGDIVGAALFLASSHSDYITGVTLLIDGGMGLAGSIA